MYSPEDLERRDGTGKIVLPEGLGTEEAWVVLKETGTILTVKPTEGRLAEKGKEYPVFMNPERTTTSARYGFAPLSREMAVERLGGEKGERYYREWWGIKG